MHSAVLFVLDFFVVISSNCIVQMYNNIVTFAYSPFRREMICDTSWKCVV